MIEARLLFGEGPVDVRPPDRAQLRGGDGSERGPRLEPVADQEAAVREALARPLGLPRLSEMVKPGDSVLIAFDDPTVPSFGPVRRLAIEAVLEDLAAAGVPEENVNLVCANALHRKWTASELSSILGPDLVRRFGARSTWRPIRWTHTPDGMSMSVRENRMHTVLDEMGAVVQSRLKRPVFKVETVLAHPTTIGRVWDGGGAGGRAA